MAMLWVPFKFVLLFVFLLSCTVVDANYYTVNQTMTGSTVYEIDEDTGAVHLIYTVNELGSVVLAGNIEKKILYIATPYGKNNMQVVYFNVETKGVVKTVTVPTISPNAIPSSIVYVESTDMIYVADTYCNWRSIDADEDVKYINSGICEYGVVGQAYANEDMIMFGYILCQGCSVIIQMNSLKDNNTVATQKANSLWPYLWLISDVENGDLYSSELGSIMLVTMNGLSATFTNETFYKYFRFGVYNADKNAIVGLAIQPTTFVIIDLDTFAVSTLPLQTKLPEGQYQIPYVWL